MVLVVWAIEKGQDMCHGFCCMSYGTGQDMFNGFGCMGY